MVRQLRAAQRASRGTKTSTKRPSPLENQIQRAIMDRLSQLPYLKIERNNRGQKGHVRFGLGDGAADLVGLVRAYSREFRDEYGRLPVGRFFALEIKVPGKEMEPHQEAWAESVRALGGYVGCAHSVEEALAHAEEARRI